MEGKRHKRRERNRKTERDTNIERALSILKLSPELVVVLGEGGAFGGERNAKNFYY